MEETVTTTTAKKGGINPIIIVVIVVIIIAGLGYMMMKSNSSKKSTEETSVTPTEAMAMDDTSMKTTTAPAAADTGTTAPEGSTTTSDVKVVEVEAGSFYFKPNVITVKKGQKVKIVLKAVSMMHDFNIDELNVDMPIVKNGDTGTVEFTADQAGTFEYYCSVGQHRAQGQVGKLIVE